MWNELRREGMKAEKDVGDRPGMWEVDFGGAGLSKGEDLDMTGQEKPLEMYEVSHSARRRPPHDVVDEAGKLTI
jgi:hypothetical protein